jgi:hypothetical protein
MERDVLDTDNGAVSGLKFDTKIFELGDRLDVFC